MDDKRKSQLEDLPDELLLIICRYLNVIDILNSFTCLNNRLSKTISEFSKEIDLNLIPYKLINRFLNEIFPSISSNVNSIKFSDNFQYFPIDIKMFKNIESIHFLNKISEDYLINVKEIEIDLVPVDIEMNFLKNLISSNEYSNLKTLSIISFHGFTFSNVQLTNLNSIESLKITLKNNSDLFELLYLFCSSIEYLNVHIVYNGPFKSLSNKIFQLIKLKYFYLKTTFEDSIQFKQLKYLINQSFPFIEILSIQILTRDQFYIDGYQWEEFLNKLIYLKQFHCAIRYRFKINENDQQYIREQNIFQSFSTDFWLNQRKWFIQFYSNSDFNHSNQFYKINNYGKLFLHTIPYPYTSIDLTSHINTAKSTLNQSLTKSIYSNVRQVYYDGENLPIKLENLKNILNKFKSINELKFDRLIIDSSTFQSNQINLSHLNKLIIYNNDERINLNINFLNLESMFNLQYIRIPQISFLHYSQILKQLQTLILTECRDLHFDFIHQFENLRLLKLYLNNFDRLLENNGELIMNLIKSIYNHNHTLESLQLMCHGANQTKLKLFEKQFSLNNENYLNANYDGKSLTIQRSIQFFY